MVSSRETSSFPESAIRRQSTVERMTQARRTVSRDRGLYASHPGPNHSYTQLQETYNEGPRQTDTCRHCNNTSETIQHITGACTALVQTEYKHRHDQVAAIIYQNLAYKCKLIKEIIPYYKYKTILENTDLLRPNYNN